MGRGKILFESIRELRKGYIAEYSPPMVDFRFATLVLTYLGKANERVVVENMEAEARAWLARFPIPIMVFACDDTGRSIGLESVRSEDNVIAFLGPEGEVETHWHLLKDEELPAIALDRDFLFSLFAPTGYKTSADIEKAVKKHRTMVRTGWYLVFLWAVVLPTIVALVEFFSPQWLAVIVLGYSLSKAGQEAMRLFGKAKKSPSQLKKENEQRRIQHHHYHCERNPDGFTRLKLENFERWGRERILSEADQLRSRKQ